MNAEDLRPRVKGGNVQMHPITLGAMIGVVTIIATVLTLAVSIGARLGHIEDGISVVCRNGVVNNADLRFLIVQHEDKEGDSTQARALRQIFRDAGKQRCD